MRKLGFSPALLLAIKEAAIRDSLPLIDTNEPAHTFSQGFTGRMERLIKQQKKPYYHMVNTIGKRVAIIILTFMVAATTLVCSVEAFRRPVFNFVVEVYETFSTFVFHAADSEQSCPSTIEHTYLPDFQGDGFTLVNTVKDRVFARSEYQNSNGDSVTFMQFTLQGFEHLGDTEDTVIEKITVCGEEGLSYTNKNISTIIWNNGEYAFWISSNLSKDALVNLANSTKIVE